MKDYLLSGLVTVEVTTRVRARSLKEAVRIAGEREVSHRVTLDSTWSPKLPTNYSVRDIVDRETLREKSGGVQ